MKFIPVSSVKLADPLWSKQFAHVKDVVPPFMWEILNDRLDILEKSHCIEYFKVAASLSQEAHYGGVFADTDLYKWIEAVSYVLSAECDPALAAMAIFIGMTSWNNYLWPLLVLKDSAKFTLPIGLSSLMSPYGNNYQLLIAGSVLSVIPIILLFIAAQKFFIEGLTAGSVKG